MTQSTAEYIAANNNDVYKKSLDWDPVDSHMVVLNKNTGLIESINTAIGEMKADGTLAVLTRKNIDAVLNYDFLGMQSRIEAFCEKYAIAGNSRYTL